MVIWAVVLGASVGIAAGSPMQTGKPAAAPKPAAAAPKPARAEFDRVTKEASAAREAGRVEESVQLYEKAVRLQPGWTEGYWYLGTGYYDLDRYSQARDAFRRVLRSQDSNGPAHAFEGLCEFQLKNYDVALDELFRAKDLGLGDNKELMSVVHFHTAIVLTRLEQFERALSALQYFTQQNNDTPKVIEAFGLATLRMPLLPDELPPDRREVVMLAGRGAYYQAARLSGPAKPAFEQLIAQYPDVPNTHYAYGVYLLSEDPDRAIEEFKKELERSPAHLASVIQIAFEYIKRSDWDAAKPWAEKAVAMNPKDYAGRKALGQVLLETGDTDHAIEELELGVKLAPDSPSLRFALARAYQKAGRGADADRERAEFRRLERDTRAARFGEQSVGGTDARTQQ